MYSQSQNRATQKYVKNNYDRLAITVKKGEKEQIRSAAEKAGMSINEFVNNAIYEKIKGSN